MSAQGALICINLRSSRKPPTDPQSRASAPKMSFLGQTRPIRIACGRSDPYPPTDVWCQLRNLRRANRSVLFTVTVYAPTALRTCRDDKLACFPPETLLFAGRGAERYLASPIAADARIFPCHKKGKLRIGGREAPPCPGSQHEVYAVSLVTIRRRRASWADLYPRDSEINMHEDDLQALVQPFGPWSILGSPLALRKLPVSRSR